jgi:hypothetical protein
MKGDFSRDTFNLRKHFARVLLQQGRVQLDADWNEQISILLHYMQTLAKDLIGPYGGPAERLEDGTSRFGFQIGPFVDATGTLDLHIGSGRYYVNGILCENEVYMDSQDNLLPTYFRQIDYPLDPKLHSLPKNFLVYLDVWERFVTYHEDESIREVALAGLDTAARSKVVWQVKVTDKILGKDIAFNEYTGQSDWKQWTENHWTSLAKELQAPNRGLLRVRTKEAISYDDEPAIVPPAANYRGIENQLYRVEIHRSGVSWDGTRQGMTHAATFKWSRDNGSIVFPILSLEGTVAIVENLSEDSPLTLKIGELVEVADDHVVLHGQPGQIAQVVHIDLVSKSVTLQVPEGVVLPSYDETSSSHPLLRRWDHRPHESSEEVDLPVSSPSDGGLLIEENQWFSLEAGIQVFFEGPHEANSDRYYRSGDYWIIPARTATSDVEWPQETDNQGQTKKDEKGRSSPGAIPPRGVIHHYAPLAVVVGETVYDLRRSFLPSI